MGRPVILALVAGVVLLVGCGGSDDGAGEASQITDGETVTVSGVLDAMLLDEGMCGFVETEDGRVEVWVGEQHGQVFNFLEDGTFEGLRAIDPAEADGVGDLVVVRGDHVTVTGTTYDAEPGCGAYGVDSSGPITAD